jgi:photosystem II stability/assembly factor-like uncharacterized protein
MQERVMKTKAIVSICVFVLILAALACQFPGCSQPTLESATSTPTDEPLPELPVFSNPEIVAFNMFTPTRGWAVTQDQNHLLITVDGGQTWLEATPPDLGPLPGGYTSFGIQPCFLDENTAWFLPNSAGIATLYHTQDGGQHWTTTSPPFDNARCDLLDLNTSYALVSLGAGAGSHYVALYRTQDGGTNWTMVFTHEPGEQKSLREGGSKNGITFRDVNHGWIGGAIPMDDYFYLFHTVDGGVTWAQEPDIALPAAFTGSMLDVWQPLFVDATTAFLPVQTYPPSGVGTLLIYRSTDSGETWTYRGFVEGRRDVDFISADMGWLAADLALFQTLDGGVIWTTMATTGIPPGEFFLKVDFVDSLHGWVLTTPDDMTWDPVKLYRTTDGGASWVLLLP